MIHYSKIISFLPSATEMLFELGLGECLKGVTHECFYPEEALKKPKVIYPSINFDNLSCFEIDKKIREMSIRKEPIFILNTDKIIEIKPDLIISQNLCSVCAPFDKETKQVYGILGYEPKNLVINPYNVNDVLQSILLIGNEVGNLYEAKTLYHHLKTRLDNIATILKKSLNDEMTINRCRVLCLDWVNPFYLAGHWVPDMVNIAGGTNLIGDVGCSSRMISLKEISEYNPNKIIIMPCGFEINRTLTEYKLLKENILWNSLKVVENKEVYIVDSKSYFSKPSPRIITGIEILCKILYPKIFENLMIPENSYIRI